MVFFNFLSASMKQILMWLGKNQPKPWKISTKKSTKIIGILYIFFLKTIKLFFTDMIIYPINNITDHISEKYIFIEKSKTEVDIFLILGWIWNRIWIRYFTKRTRGSK